MLKKLIAFQGPAQHKNPEPVRTPKRNGDVGYDLCASEDTMCPRGVTWIPTGVAIDAQNLWYMVVARSSLHRRGLLVAMGVIDGGYQGEVLVCVVNLGEPVVISKGEYIAQCIFFDITQPRLHEVVEFQPSERGTNGFGSTER